MCDVYVCIVLSVGCEGCCVILFDVCVKIGYMCDELVFVGGVNLGVGCGVLY